MSLENYSVEQIQHLANVSNDLLSNEKTREPYLRLAKMVSPDTPIPEIDIKDQMRAYAKPLIEKINSLEQQVTQRQHVDTVLNKRNDLYERGFNKTDVEKIEKLMIDKSIPSHETAAEFYRMQKQTATPTPSTMTPISLPSSVVESHKNGGQVGMNQWSRGEAYSAIADLQAKRVTI